MVSSLNIPQLTKVPSDQYGEPDGEPGFLLLAGRDGLGFPASRLLSFKVLFLMIILINSTIGRLVRWRSEVEIFLGRWRRGLAGQPQVGRAVPG